MEGGAATATVGQRAGARIVAIDWMRGFVMVLMAIDHAAMFFDDGHVSEDSASMYEAGTTLDAAQFFTRWITHLCAPTFVFLAGTAIAVSTAKRRASGMSARAIDTDLFVRGAFIASLDLVVMSGMSGHFLLQVLYAIGVSMMAMVFLRRLGVRTLLALALVIVFGGEAVTGLVWDPHGGPPALWVGLLLAPRFTDGVVILYPVLGWLAMMMLGWVFGDWLVTRDPNRAWPPERLLTAAGLAALAIFAVVRGIDGYGNMFLHRDDGSLVQWLHVSKYPPALAFTALELGLMALCLAGLMKLEPFLVRTFGTRDRGLLLVLGQTALFFYLAHFALLGTTRAFVAEAGLARGYLVAAAVVLALYPACLGYRALKRRYPRSLLRFV